MVEVLVRHLIGKKLIERWAFLLPVKRRPKPTGVLTSGTCHRVNFLRESRLRLGNPTLKRMKASEIDRACKVDVIVSSGRSVAELVNIEL